MASVLSDDASVFAQQKQCGSDLNLRKVVPKREMTMYFLVEKKTMMTKVHMCRRSGGSFWSEVWVHCGFGDLSFLRGLADNRAMDLGLCRSSYGCHHIQRQGYISVEEMVRRHDKIT